MASSFWIQTATGGAFDLGDPQPDMVRFDDIALSLCKVQRFSGHTMGLMLYPVATHLVNCLRATSWHQLLLPNEDETEEAVDVFTHDFYEAYVGDLSTPFKQMLADAAGREVSAAIKRVERAVRAAFKLTEVVRPVTTIIDARILLTEKKAFLVPDLHDRGAWAIERHFAPYQDVQLSAPPTPKDAYTQFMAYAKLLNIRERIGQ